MAIGSAGGFADSVQAEREGWKEEMEEKQRVREEIIASIPPCPACGGPRDPVRKWKGEDPHPPIKCNNPDCVARPRMTKATEW